MFTKGNKFGALRKKVKHTEASKEKMRESHLLFFKNGGTVWNKGKKRPPFSDEWKRKIGISMKGKNKGRGLGRKDSQETRIKKSQSAKLRGIKPPSWMGKKHTAETIRKMSVAQKGHPVAEHVRRALRQARIDHPNRIFKDTSIELKVEAELQGRSISYQKQVPLCKVAIVDFYLPESNSVIQCDGDYWHNIPRVQERDKRQDKILCANGFNIYRFWEYEIRQSASACIDRVKLI